MKISGIKTYNNQHAPAFKAVSRFKVHPEQFDMFMGYISKIPEAQDAIFIKENPIYPAYESDFAEIKERDWIKAHFEKLGIELTPVKGLDSHEDVFAYVLTDKDAKDYRRRFSNIVDKNKIKPTYEGIRANFSTEVNYDSNAKFMAMLNAFNTKIQKQFDQFLSERTIEDGSFELYMTDSEL